MRHPFLTQRRVFFMLILPALVISCFLPEKWARSISKKPRGLVRTIFTPVTSPLLSLGHYIRGTPEQPTTPTDKDDLEKNYWEMLRYTRQLEDDLARARAQITQLTQIRGAQDLHATQLLLATVSSQPNSITNPIITIDQGTNQGVKPGQVVAVSDGLGLAGLVKEADTTTADVGLITKPGVRLDVWLIPPTAGAAQRRTLAQLIANDQGTFETELGMDKSVELGDLAHLSDDRWPVNSRGFVVGKVISISPLPRDPLAYRKIVVQPMKSLANLREVLVLIPITTAVQSEPGRPGPGQSPNNNPVTRTPIAPSSRDKERR